MIKNHSLKLGQTSTIYSKECPVCGRYSMEETDECWNCHFQFVKKGEKRKALFNSGEKALIGLSIILVCVIGILRYLVG